MSVMEGSETDASRLVCCAFNDVISCLALRRLSQRKQNKIMEAERQKDLY